MTVTLSDLYPPANDPDIIDGIRYHSESVDATKPPHEIPGIVTVFTAFHHFDPIRASTLLRNVSAQGRSVAIFEATERSILALAQVVIAALLVFLVTPFIRPFSFTRLLFTYVIPLVPFLILFDGVASVFRSYSEKDLEALAAYAQTPHYTWRAGRIPASLTKPAITFLLGSPSAHPNRSRSSYSARLQSSQPALEAFRQAPR